MSAKSITGFLAEECQDLSNHKPIGEDRVKEVCAAMDVAILENKFDPNEIDYNDLFEAAMPESLFEAFKRSAGKSRNEQAQSIKAIEKDKSVDEFATILDHTLTRHMNAYRPTREMSLEEAANILKEESIAPITASQIDRFRERCVTRTLADFSCPVAGFGFQDTFTRINDPCSDYRDNKVCEFPLDPPPDFCCMNTSDDDPAQFYGLGDERCWKMPHPCYIGFAFAMHRNLVCLNANAFVRQQIEARRAWFNIIDERKRTRLMFNAFESNDCDTYPYTYNGVTYASGYQDAAAGAPWVNMITDPDLAWSACNEGPMCAIEQIYEDQRDPMNGFPITCDGDFEVTLTRDCNKYQFWEVLGQRTYNRALQGGSCCGTAESVRPARDGWNKNFRYSRWAWDILVDFYLNHYSGTYNGTGFATLATRLAGNPTRAKAAAEYYAANTYLVSKSISQTWGEVVDFDISTRELSGVNTWMYFDRGITWARRYERKQTDAWLRPWMTILVRAFNPLLDADGAVI